MGLTEESNLTQVNKDVERSKRETMLLEKRFKLSQLQLKIKMLVDEVVENDREIKNLQGEIRKSSESKCREEMKYVEEMGKFNELLQENAKKRIKEEETVQKLTDIQSRCQIFTKSIDELKKCVDAEKVDYENQMNTYKINISQLSAQLEGQMGKVEMSKSSKTFGGSTLSEVVYFIQEEDVNDLETKLANVDARIHEELKAKVLCNEKLTILIERAHQFNSNIQNLEHDFMSCKAVASTQIFTVEDQISELNAKANQWRLEKAKLEKQCSVVKVEKKRKEKEINTLRETLEELEIQVSLKQAQSHNVQMKLEEREQEIENLTRKRNRSSASGNVEMDLLKFQASAMCNDVNMAKHRLRMLRDSIGAENRRVSLAEEKLLAQNKETCSMEGVGGTQRAEKEHDPVYPAKLLDLNRMATMRRTQAMEINEMCKNELLKEKQQLEDSIQQLEQQNKKLEDLSEKESKMINEAMDDIKTSAENGNMKQPNNKVMKDEYQLKSSSQRRLAEIMEERRQGLSGLSLNITNKLSLKDLQPPNGMGTNQGLHQALSSAKEELRILQEVKSKLPVEVNSLQEKCEQLKCQYKARMELLKNRIQELREKSKHNLLQEEDIIEGCTSISPTSVAKLREKWDNFAKSFSQDETH